MRETQLQHCYLLAEVVVLIGERRSNYALEKRSCSLWLLQIYFQGN